MTQTPNSLRSLSTSPKLPWITSAGVLALLIFILWCMGRIWWCELGDWAFYIPDAWNSSHTSQHVVDPYSWTHLLHGVFFYWVAILLLRNWTMPWQFTLAVVVEAGWEIFENTSFVINKYRENTASLDYFGDSITNSAADTLCCALGFWIAWKVGWRWSIFVFLLVEAMLLVTIRDSLVLNVIMLLIPLDFIKEWQMAAW